MKFILFLLAFVAVSLGEEIPEFILECAKEFKIDVSKMDDSKFLEEMKTDHNFQCFAKCAITTIGFVKENGDLDEDLIRKHLKETTLTDAEFKEIKDCSDKHKEEDSCARFSAITECIFPKGMNK